MVVGYGCIDLDPRGSGFSPSTEIACDVHIFVNGRSILSLDDIENIVLGVEFDGVVDVLRNLDVGTFTVGILLTI